MQVFGIEYSKRTTNIKSAAGNSRLKHSLGASRVLERGVDEGVDEVAAGLVGQHHVSFQHARGAQLAQAGSGLSRRGTGQVAKKKKKLRHRGGILY